MISRKKTRQVWLLAALLLGPWLVPAQLIVTVLPPKVLGQKAVVPLALRNGLADATKDARIEQVSP